MTDQSYFIHFLLPELDIDTIRNSFHEEINCARAVYKNIITKVFYDDISTWYIAGKILKALVH